LLEDFQRNRTEEPLLPFGNRGDDIRRKITQKHQKWKELPREKCLVKLARLKVKPAAANDWTHRSTSLRSSSDEDSSASLLTKSEDKNLVTPKKTSKNAAPKASTTKSKKQGAANVPAVITTTSPEEVTKDFSFQKSPTPRSQTNSSWTMASGDEEIDALAKSLGKLIACATHDVESFFYLTMLLSLFCTVGAKPVICPKIMKRIRHDEGVHAVPINKHKVVDADGKATQWEGISIEMLGDFNDHQDGKWSATHVAGHDNVILVTEPALPKSMVSRKSKAMHDTHAETSVIEGRDIAITAFKKEAKRNLADDSATTRKHLVVLPPGVRLSNKPFQSEDFKDDPNVDPDVNVDYVITHVRSETGWEIEEQDNAGQAITHSVYTFSSWIKWRFVDLSTQIDISDPKKKKKTVSKLGSLDKFESMNLGSSDEDDDGEWQSSCTLEFVRCIALRNALTNNIKRF